MNFIQNIELSEKTLLLVSILPYLFFGFHTTYWYDAKKLRLLDLILASVSIIVAGIVLLKLALARGEGASVLLGLAHLSPPIITLLILSMSRGIGRHTRSNRNANTPSPDGSVGYVPASRNSEIERLSWDDLIIQNEVKEELQSVIELLRDPSHAKKYGIDVPKGILLNGPPGTGKTTIAKVMANQAGLSFFPLKMDEVVSKWVGESEKNLSKLFQAAQRSAPAVVFIDEIDSIGKSRGGGAQPWADNLLNHLLQLIDGVVKIEGLYVIGATNRADQVDSALRRAGRLSRVIEIPLPDYEARGMLFILHLSKLKLEPGIDLDQLAAITDGRSGAEIKEICNRAGLHAYKRESGSKKRDYVVTHDDLTVALQEVLGN